MPERGCWAACIATGAELAVFLILFLVELLAGDGGANTGGLATMERPGEITC